MDIEYALEYRELYENHWWWRAREQLILSTITEIRMAGNRGSILDVGCGNGLFFERLNRFGDVDGIETNTAIITEDNPWKDRIYVCPFNNSFRPGKQYSLILMLDVLEHFPDPDACLRRAVELLSQDGVLLITVPAFACLWTSHDDLNHHLARYTKNSLAKLTSSVAVKILSCQYFFHWMFPVKLLLHYKERCLGADPHVPEVPNRFINGLLYWVSVAEQRIFGARPLPFGSSLLAVCSKQDMAK